MGGDIKRNHDAHAELGARLKALRLAAGLSQAKMAGEIGMAFQQFGRIERGQNRVNAVDLFKLSKLLDIPIASILTDDKKEFDRVLKVLRRREREPDHPRLGMPVWVPPGR